MPQRSSHPPAPTLDLLRPSLSIASATFSDGTKLEFDDDEIVVFVGPNNAGKSAALRELQSWISSTTPQSVIKNVDLKRVGTQADFVAYLEENSLKTGDVGQMHYSGIGYNIHHSHVMFFETPQNRKIVAPFFSARLATETRITDSNPAGAIELYSQPPSHPIHLLMEDDKLASNISALFKRAFGQELIVFRAGGSSFPLYVGKTPPPKKGVDALSRSYVDSLKMNAVPLHKQGDGMRSFASVILHTLLAKNHTIQFLDEPEAFLHPP